MKTRAHKFPAKEWLEGEIQAQIDSYGNTRAQAVEMVTDLLMEGEYGDVLGFSESVAVWKQIRKLEKGDK